VLGIPGEHVVDIRPFALPPLQGPAPEVQAAGFDGCRLFVDRAQALDPDFAFTSANARDVVSICQRLDGLPLAIELAAAWVSVLSPPALLAQLETGLALPRCDALGVPQRHRTMRDTIAWSYGLLSPPSQELFRRLAVFMGGCTLDAAKDVCSDGRLDILQELRVLVANSLVRRVDIPGDASRYTMLETVRQYGVERLDSSGEAGAIRQRYADFVLALARQVESKLNTIERKPLLDHLELEQGNLSSVLAWALEREDAEFALALSGSLLPFWQFHFHSSAGRNWIRKSLAIDKEVSAPVMRKALYCAGMLACLHGEDAEAEAFLTDALARYQEADDSLMMGRVELSLGRLAWDKGDMVIAQCWFERAKERFDRHGDDAGLAQILHYMGLVALTNGDYPLAETSLRDALTLWQSLGFTWELASCIPGHLADVARAEGNLTKAMTRYQECLSLNWDRQDRENVAWSLAGLAIIASSDDQVNEAGRLLALADQFRELTGAPLTPHIERDHRLAAGIVTDRVGAERYASIRADIRNGEPAVGIAAALEMTRSEAPPPETPGAGIDLTQRGREVLRLIAAGKSNQNIAELLFVSPGTVKVHVTHILSKLGVRSRSAATDYAHRHLLA
jgi:predicted ATPase/DNA-binding CsgD family transcriptional regulator